MMETKTLETQVTEAAKEDQKQLTEDEAAAYFIYEAHKEFKRLAYALAERKKHSVARVLEAVLFEPLEEVHLLGKHEEELFAICQEIMYNKGKLLKHTMDLFEKKTKGELNESKEK